MQSRSLRQRHLTFGSYFAVSSHRAVAHVQTGHQRRSRGRANRRAGVSLHVPRSFGRHAIEIWRLDQLLPITTQVTLSDVVGEDEDDVGFFGYRGFQQHESGDQYGKVQYSFHGFGSQREEGESVCVFQVGSMITRDRVRCLHPIAEACTCGPPSFSSDVYTLGKRRIRRIPAQPFLAMASPPPD